VCEASEGRFFKLPALPPKPDISLSDLTPVRWSGPGRSYRGRSQVSGRGQAPQKDRSIEGEPLRLRGVDYAKGIGTHAPNQMIFEVKPEYDRFVALAGVDERILQVSHGANLARYPSVVFKVFVDGREVASSPLMRIAEQPWRFDVRLPTGAKRISLCATDAGDGNREDLANWVDAGFVTDRSGRGVGR
jgi:NPCBM/NEW2 domain